MSKSLKKLLKNTNPEIFSYLPPIRLTNLSTSLAENSSCLFSIKRLIVSKFFTFTDLYAKLYRIFPRVASKTLVTDGFLGLRHDDFSVIHKTSPKSPVESQSSKVL